MILQRIVLDYRTGELVVRALYRTEDGPNPGTRARAREVSNLVRSGLEQALTALEDGSVEAVGTSGFTTREDTILCTGFTPDTHTDVHKKPTKGAASANRR